MKIMQAMELRDAMLLEAHSLDDDDLLYVVCFRLAVELNHYALIKRRRIGEGPGKKKKKKSVWQLADERTVGLTMSKKKKKK